MPRRFYAFLLLATLLGMAGCNNGGDIQLTLVSQNLELSTEIADIRSTATYAADKLNMTAEYLQTAVPQIASDNQLLSITLAASGVNAANVTPGALVPTPLPAGDVQTINGSTPLTTEDVNSSGQQNTALGTPAAGSGTPSLYNIVLAAGVGSNDCALAATSSFPSTTEKIYVVATAANIAPGTKLSSHWFSGATEVVFHDFTPDFNIAQNCIWFYIDQTDTPFTVGNWSVQLDINDQPAGSPVTFSISG
ncbi:MAG: hypothetical protein ABI690_21695 [Chloroflexota bacterium]